MTAMDPAIGGDHIGLSAVAGYDLPGRFRTQVSMGRIVHGAFFRRVRAPGGGVLTSLDAQALLTAEFTGAHALIIRPLRDPVERVLFWPWGTDRSVVVINEGNLIWVDMEMTGLNPDSDRVIEIATVVTDSALNTLAEGPVLAIHQDDATLAAMDEWNTTHHGRSGLTQRVRESTVDEAAAARETLAFLTAWVPPGVSPMCGNSICQDRRFMARYLPDLERFFHYRNLDVSTVKILAQRWRPEVLAGVRKQGAHLALDDIRDSIAELRHYRDTFLRCDSVVGPSSG